MLLRNAPDVRLSTLSGTIVLLAVVTTWVALPCHAQTTGTGSGGVTYTVQQVWNDGTDYDAFTDLTRYNGSFYLVFRSAIEHGIPPAGQPGGSIRVLKSPDGVTWTSAALLSNTGADLRDPKISVTPSNQLMITTGSVSQTAPNAVQSAAYFSTDGTNWGTPQPTGDYDWWTWRTVWHNGIGYGISYGPNNTDPNQKWDQATRLLTTTDGVSYNPLVLQLTPTAQGANEAGMTFLADGTAVTLIRRDIAANAIVGISTGDYTHWTNTTSNMYLASPDLLTLPDGRIVAAGRMYTGTPSEPVPNTTLCWLDPATATLTPFVIFPDNINDSGYPGMEWYNDKLWLSFYSNTDGPQAIYVAQVSIPAIPEPGTLGLLAAATAVGFGFWWRRRRRTKFA